MDRVIVANNTKQNIYEVFEDFQDNVELELRRLYATAFQEYGVVAETIDGEISSSDLALKVSKHTDTAIKIDSGYGILPTGEILAVGESGAIFSVSGDGTYSIYLIPKIVNTDFVERLAGFQYGAGTSTTPSRSVTDVDITTVETVNSGIVLADITLVNDVVSSTVVDRRGENILKLNADLYDESNVVRTNQDSVVTGTIQVNGLKIKATDSDAIVTISGELNNDLDAAVTLSGLVNAYNWAHEHSVDVFNPHSIEVTAAELNNLMNYGIINYDDGYGDRLIVTAQIPSKPNDVSGIQVDAYQFQPPTTFSQTFLSDLSSYQANRISIVRQTEKRNNLSRLSGVVSAWLINNSGLSWDDAWTAADVIDAYGHTLSGLAQTIIDYGYASTSEVGFNGPDIGTTVSDLVDHIDLYKDQAESERQTYSFSVQAVAENISVQAERALLQPELIRPTFRAKITWSSPTLVDNEQITHYIIKTYRVFSGDWSSPPSASDMGEDADNVAVTMDIQEHESLEARKVLTFVGTKTVSSVTNDTNFVLSNTTGLQAGDYIYRGLTPTDKSILFTVNAGNAITLVKPFDTDPSVGHALDFYREQYEDSSALRTFWMNIDRDQDYVVYVRAVSEYGIYGDWSDGLSFSTNTLLVGTDTVLDLLNSRDTIIRQVSQAQQVALRQDLETTVAELSRQVSSQPDMVSISNLTTAFKDLKTTVDAL